MTETMKAIERLRSLHTAHNELKALPPRPEKMLERLRKRSQLLRAAVQLEGRLKSRLASMSAAERAALKALCIDLCPLERRLNCPCSHCSMLR